MGSYMDGHADNMGAATRYLVEIGTLEECWAHGVTYGGGGSDLDAAFYKQAMFQKNRGANGAVPWASKMGPREFTDLLKEAYEEHCGDRCEACAHYFDKD